MRELKISNVVVKELSCWKFLFTFPSIKEMDAFDWKVLKYWVEGIRVPSEEDLVIKRKVVVELRGLPLNVWSKKNIKEVVKDLGVWGWWVDRPDTSHKYENPRICLYTGIWDK